MDLKNRIKQALTGESGSVVLEAAIIIAVVCYITVNLLILMNSYIELQVTKNGYTSSTGWFRSHDVNGIMNTD